MLCGTSHLQKKKELARDVNAVTSAAVAVRQQVPVQGAAWKNHMEDGKWMIFKDHIFQVQKDCPSRRAGS